MTTHSTFRPVQPPDPLAGVTGPPGALLALLRRLVSTSVVDMAGVTDLRDGRLRFACHTDERARMIDSAQRQSRNGPWPEAARGLRTMRARVRDVRTRWPAFARAARESHAHSFLAAPLLLGGGTVGTLNLYSETSGLVDLDDDLVRAWCAAAAEALPVRPRR